MFKPVLTLAAAGVIGVVLWKVLAFVLLPVAGALLGLFMTLLKVGVLVALVLFALWLWRRSDKSEASAD